jgi:subtilisin-like proprotein convertase family protein
MGRLLPGCAWAGLLPWSAALWLAAAPSTAQPGNDACANATVVTAAAPVVGTVEGASNDGESFCNLEPTGDVYHRFVTTVAGTHTFTVCGATWDTVLSLHTGCPADALSTVACDDDGCRPDGSSAFGIASSLTIDLPAGQAYIVRVSAFDGLASPGLYTLSVIAPAPAVGACCLGASCSVQTQAVCVTAGGNYRGDWNTCTARAGQPMTFDGPTGAIAIPDNTTHAGGVTSTINVTESFTVSDVVVELTLTHPFAGDLTATLSHGMPEVTATLMQRIGGGAFGDDSNFAGTYVFSDSGFDTIWQAAVNNAPNSTSIVPTGPHRAADRFANTVSLRGQFAGQSSLGAWTLRVSDNNLADTGTLEGWRLRLDRAGGDPCDLTTGACCQGSNCMLATQAICAGPNRAFAGAGTICNVPGNLSTPCCKADFNHVGGQTVQDIFDYLVAYFQSQPDADTNGGGLSVQDLFDFLVSYFAGCP